MGKDAHTHDSLSTNEKRTTVQWYHLLHLTPRPSCDQLAGLKQIKSAKAYSPIFRTVALRVTDLSPAESLDRYLRGLKKHVRAQVLIQKLMNT
jgi:hypothetical protein